MPRLPQASVVSSSQRAGSVSDFVDEIELSGLISMVLAVAHVRRSPVVLLLLRREYSSARTNHDVADVVKVPRSLAPGSSG
jgi:hypothetical protein